MQATAPQSHFDRLPPNPKRLELSPGHDPMLPPGKLRDPFVQPTRLL
jgi:hypothetical protein